MTLAKLSNRPKWNVPKFVFISMVLSACLAIIFWILGDVLYEFAESKLGPGEEDDEIWLHFISYNVTSAAEAIGYLFLTLIGCWIMALGVDKLDALVWLAASEEDRQEILDNKKNAKNQ